MNKLDYQKYQKAVEHNLQGLDFVSTGACPSCAECGLSDNPTDSEREIADEPHFSWHVCDCCGSALGGDRYPAHGRDKGNQIVHFTVCTDCLYYLNYGQLDDATMMEIEAE